MTAIRLDTADGGWVEDPRLAAYRVVRDPLLVKQSGRFIAEGRMVVRTLLEDSPLAAESILLDETAYTALVPILEAHADVPVYVVPAGALHDLAGWRFHQGCLAVGRRPTARDVDATLRAAGDPRVVVGLEAVSNPDNVGAIFRSAAALGAGAVVLGPACASPLYRKAIRSSMGAALRLPFAHVPAWSDGLDALQARGHRLLALVADPTAEPLAAVAEDLGTTTRCTLLLGAEGDGLSDATVARADHRVVIPMEGGIDSLNVAAAAAIALERLRHP